MRYKPCFNEYTGINRSHKLYNRNIKRSESMERPWFDNKWIGKLRESYLQVELENYEYTCHMFFKAHLVLKQVYNSLLDAYVLTRLSLLI